MALGARAQLQHHVAVGGRLVEVLDGVRVHRFGHRRIDERRTVGVRCGGRRGGRVVGAAAAAAQRHQIAVAGLARLAQAAVQIELAGDAPLAAGQRRTAGALAVVMVVVVLVLVVVIGVMAIARVAGLDGRGVGRDGLLDFVQLLGHRGGGVLDAAEAALQQFVGLFAGEAGTVGWGGVSDEFGVEK